jgi:UDP-3-O-[3-hydroxymyristoyl] glucosamine N-acyltransferase
MPVDPRFVGSAGPQRLGDILGVAGADCPAADPERRLADIAPLEAAGPEEVSFLENRKYLPQLAATRAGAVLLAPEYAAKVPAGCLALVTKTPALGFARVARLFHPPAAPRPGIHPTAVVEPGAVIGAGCEIGPYAVIGAGAELGAGCVVGPHGVVGPGTVLGEGCRLHAHASISHCVAGRRVVLHPGARVGQEGFGLVPTPEGRFETMPQLGRVLLGDEVEIGANSTIDRGAQGDTVIGQGTRIDNLVMIGHNVRIGRGCVIVSQVGIAGSTTLGDYVQVAGQVGFNGHVEVGSFVRIGAQAGVMHDVPAKTDIIGSPAMPAREFWKTYARLQKLAAGTKTGGKTE